MSTTPNNDESDIDAAEAVLKERRRAYMQAGNAQEKALHALVWAKVRRRYPSVHVLKGEAEWDSGYEVKARATKALNAQGVIIAGNTWLDNSVPEELTTPEWEALTDDIDQFLTEMANWDPEGYTSNEVFELSSPEDDPTPPVDVMPTTLLEEIVEVFRDLGEDFGHSIVDTSQDVHNKFRQILLQVMSQEERSIDDRFNGIATLMMWMFLVGREHHHRGFDNPLPRNDVEGRDLISDEMIARFLGED